MEFTEVHDTDEPTIRFQVDVALPAEQAEAYFDRMTGNDDDILLAAERAMREELGWEAGREIELSYAEGEREMRQNIGLEVITDRDRVRHYGPVA